ncbi:MAG: aryl-sulfate sulfotransferase, partial [Bacteroidota bacterium]
VDLSGNTYHSWTFNANAKTCYGTYLLPGGVLLRTVNHAGNFFQGGPISGEIQKVDWNGNVTWDFVYSTQDYCAHHDIHGMPNGNVLIIAYERKTAAEAIQAGATQSIEMWPDKIVEVQPTGTNTGTVVWEWHAWDHLVQDHDATKNNYGVVANHPELLNINYNITKDWMHMNGIDYNPDLDQITFTSHNLNELYVIDHSTTTAEAATHSGGNSGKGGDLLYRWGNPAAYQTAGTTIFNVVHDAHWVSPDDPRFPNALAGFNNKGGAGGKSCADIFTPPYNGYNYSLTPGMAYSPPTYTWRTTYSGNPTPDNGNSQQLPNGNTLLCIGMSGFIYEVDSNQNQVWSKTIGGTLPQSFRYPPCFVTGNYSADATANPASICIGESTQLNVTVTSGEVYKYKWSSNPTGFTSNIKNPVVTPGVTTTYRITVVNGPCSATDSVIVVVNPIPPIPTITSAGDSLISSSSSGNQWYLGGTLIPGATGQVYLPAQGGSYQVKVTLSGCSSLLSDPFLFTGIAETFPGVIRVFPNPTKGIIWINGSENNFSNYKVEIYNLTGNRIFEETNSGRIDLSCFSEGIYMINIVLADGIIITKKISIIK